MFDQCDFSILTSDDFSITVDFKFYQRNLPTNYLINERGESRKGNQGC